MIVAIALHSRISALMALMGAALAALVAVIFGGPEGATRDCLFGYNAALTALALGGFFLVLTVRSFIYTVFGVIVTTLLWASVAIFLEPIGPVLTSTFVIVTWAMLIGQYGFKALIPVQPPEATTPEDNLRRYRDKHDWGHQGD